MAIDENGNRSTTRSFTGKLHIGAVHLTRMTGFIARKIANRMLNREGLSAIWLLHRRAADAYRNGYRDAANSVIKVAEAAEQEWLDRQKALTITHARLRRLYECWLDKRDGRRFPSRADFDPIELRFILGNVSLIDVIEGSPPDFRFRLHGSNLAFRLAYELTGKMLDELPQPAHRERMLRTFAAVVAAGEPEHGRRERVVAGMRLPYEIVALPLSANGTDINMLLVGVVYDNAPLGISGRTPSKSPRPSPTAPSSNFLPPAVKS
jgi:hypothetical protein